MTRPILAAAFAALLALPLAAAFGEHPTDGFLATPADPALRGAASLHGAGLLELDVPGAGLPVRVAFDRLVEGWLVERSRQQVDLLVPQADAASIWTPQEERTTLGEADAGTVEGVRCGLGCLVAVRAVDGAGLVGADGFLEGALPRTPEAREVSTSTLQSQEWQFTYVVPKGAFEVSNAPPLEGGRPWIAGRVELVLADATFDLVTPEGRRAIDARVRDETMQDAAGHAFLVRHHARHALLVLEGARLEIAANAPFRLSFPSGLDVDLDGTLDAERASGVLLVSGGSHALNHEEVRLDGAMTLRLRPPAPGLAADGHGLDAIVRGRMRSVLIGGSEATPLVSDGARAAGVNVLAVAALLALARFVLLPLYHRLTPSDVLANDNRRRIHDALRGMPGAGVADLVRALGMPRILVRHHLQVLQAHRLVVGSRWGRRRTYAPAGEKAGPALLVLRDATRRRVAAAILAEEKGATQKGLVAALGLSQRLVSYHLAKLEAAELVRGEGRNPRAYHATPPLAFAMAKGKEREAAAPEERAAASSA